ncbi:MAG: LPS export ABC transporter permease LptG [bacterium]
MKILDRYIIRRFVLTLVFALVSFILVVIFVDMVGNLGKFIDKDVPSPIIFRYYLLYVPYIVTLVLPIAMLLASMFSLGHMARYNELTAIRGSGVSLNRILWPLFVLSFWVSLLSLGFGETVAPVANQQKSNIEEEYLDPFKRHSGTNMKNIFYRDKLERRIFIGRYDGKRKIAHRVTIQTYRSNFITERLDAESMQWQDGAWVLKDGYKRTFNSGREHATPFETLTDLYLDFSPEQLIEQQAKPEDMSFRELNDFISEVMRNGGDPRKWQVDLHFKFSSPFASFILVLFGAPLASNKNRSSAILGLIMSLAIYLFYFGVTRLVKTLGEVGTLPPEVAGWVTNGVFVAVGLCLLLRNRRM